jgi:exopolysaccharide biosynthesis protein
MARVMRALGCRDAILLDGGISGQLMVRREGGAVQTWAGIRSVPLGLVALPR